MNGVLIHEVVVVHLSYNRLVYIGFVSTVSLRSAWQPFPVYLVSFVVVLDFPRPPTSFLQRFLSRHHLCWVSATRFLGRNGCCFRCTVHPIVLSSFAVAFTNLLGIRSGMIRRDDCCLWLLVPNIGGFLWLASRSLARGKSRKIKLEPGILRC